VRTSAAKLLGVLIVVLLGGAAVAAPAVFARANSSAHLVGTVSCTSHMVEGVWVEVGSSSGASGWATMGNTANTVRGTTYHFTVNAPLPTNIRLHVGCGGTPSNWWSDNRTPSTSPHPIYGSSSLSTACKEGSSKPAPGDNTRCAWRYAYAYPWADATCPVGSPSSNQHCAVTGNGDYNWGYKTTCPSNDPKCMVLHVRVSGATWGLSDPYGYYLRNCTSYVAWRLRVAGVSPSLFEGLGNAGSWATNAAGRSGVVVNHTPSSGAVGVWTGIGHVAFVEYTSNGRVIYSDYNGAGTGTWNPWFLDHTSFGTPNWYIHFPGAW